MAFLNARSCARQLHVLLACTKLYVAQPHIFVRRTVLAAIRLLGMAVGLSSHAGPNQVASARDTAKPIQTGANP